MNDTATVSTNMEPPPQTPARPGSAPRRNEVRRTKRRRWLPYTGALVLIALIVAGLWPKPAPVETVKVVIGPMRSTVNEEGKTRIRQRFVVSAPVAGQLRRIPFKAGAEVKANETVVAVIDPLAPTMLDARSRALAEARRDTAAANVGRARAAHKFAASELKRFEALFADKTIAVQEFEQVQWRETSAAKELAATEAALRQAEAELAEFTNSTSSLRDATIRSPSPLNGQRAGVRGGHENNPDLSNDTSTATSHPQSLSSLTREKGPQGAGIEVKAPASGRVLRIIEESSRVVVAGTALMEVGDPADLEVVIEVLSRDGATLQPGTKVELEQWGGNEPLEARVRLVEPAAFTKVSALGVEEQRVKVIADVVTPVEKRASLGDQFRVEARLITWESDKVLKVASGAVFRRDNQHAVFAMRNGRALFQPVTIGRHSGTETEITNGLREGDDAIIYPGDRIQDGQRVKPLHITASR
jgi:HlyD family secretion protein